MHIEKNSLFSKMAAPTSKANFTHSHRVDLSKPNPVRVLACSSGKHIAVITIGLMRASGDAPPPPPPPTS